MKSNEELAGYAPLALGEAERSLRQAETGTKVKEIVRQMGITEQTFYRWKRKFGGLGPSELRKLRLLEEETRRLKKLVADLSLDKAMLQEVIEKKL